MKRVLLLVCFLAGILPASAQATLITTTLPDFQGPLIFGGSFPLPHSVGTFSYNLPSSEPLISATVSGIFGASPNFSTAPVDLFIDGLLVAQCGLSDPCTGSGSAVPWIHTFSVGEFSLLLDGKATLTASQLTPIAVAFSSMTLTLETLTQDPDPPGGGNPIPEPGTIVLLGSGLIGLGSWKWYARRKE